MSKVNPCFACHKTIPDVEEKYTFEKKDFCNAGCYVQYFDQEEEKKKETAPKPEPVPEVSRCSGGSHYDIVGNLITDPITCPCCKREVNYETEHERDGSMGTYNTCYYDSTPSYTGMYGMDGNWIPETTETSTPHQFSGLYGMDGNKYE